MTQYIDKDALIAKIKNLYDGEIDTYTRNILDRLKSNIDTLEVKEVELSWEDIKVIEKLLGFDNIIESPKEFYQEVLKRFKAQKGE